VAPIPRLATVLTGQHADKRLSDRRVLWAACARTKEQARRGMLRGSDREYAKKGRDPVGSRPSFYVLADVRFLLHSDHPLPLVVGRVSYHEGYPPLEGHGASDRGYGLSDPPRLPRFVWFGV
jgi:hypothetical protein